MDFAQYAKETVKTGSNMRASKRIQKPFNRRSGKTGITGSRRYGKWKLNSG